MGICGTERVFNRRLYDDGNDNDDDDDDDDAGRVKGLHMKSPWFPRVFRMRHLVPGQMMVMAIMMMMMMMLMIVMMMMLLFLFFIGSTDGLTHACYSRLFPDGRQPGSVPTQPIRGDAR